MAPKKAPCEAPKNPRNVQVRGFEEMDPEVKQVLEGLGLCKPTAEEIAVREKAKKPTLKELLPMELKELIEKSYDECLRLGNNQTAESYSQLMCALSAGGDTLRRHGVTIGQSLKEHLEEVEGEKKFPVEGKWKISEACEDCKMVPQKWRKGDKPRSLKKMYELMCGVHLDAFRAKICTRCFKSFEDGQGRWCQHCGDQYCNDCLRHCESLPLRSHPCAGSCVMGLMRTFGGAPFVRIPEGFFEKETGKRSATRVEPSSSSSSSSGKKRSKLGAVQVPSQAAERLIGTDQNLEAEEIYYAAIAVIGGEWELHGMFDEAYEVVGSVIDKFDSALQATPSLEEEDFNVTEVASNGENSMDEDWMTLFL